MNRNASLPARPLPQQYWNGHQSVRLAGDAWGDPAARPVMLLHGGGQTRHAWKKVGTRLAQAGYRAIAPDARGHGDSGWAPGGDYSVESMIADIGSVAGSAASAQPPALVGASMGGLTGLLAVGEGHVQASALVLVDVAPQIDPAGAARIQAFMSHKPEGFDSIEEVAELVAGYQPQRARPPTREGLLKNLRLTPAGKYRWHWDPAYNAYPRDWAGKAGRLSAAARRVRIPVLLVRGHLSDVMTQDSVDDFLRACPKAECVEIRGAGHMVAGDENDVFGNAVTEFLSRVARP